MDGSLSLSNVSIGYGHRVIAAHLNTSVDNGQLICLLGPNGSGKSTLLRCIAGLQKPLTGNISTSQSPADVSITLTTRVSIQHLTVHDMVAMGRAPHTGFFGRLTSDDEAVVNHSLQYLHIGHLAKCCVDSISDGEYQKVMIAKSLAQQTGIILLDEPTAFLDFQSKVEVMQTVSRLAHEQEKIIILSTHDINMALQFADVLWILKDGTMSCASPSEFINTGVIQEFVGKEASMFIIKK